jgi:hypothetical protein
VLKPGGHFSISDIVLVGQLPDALRKDAEMYAGCVAGAIQKSEYLQLLSAQGFANITVQKKKVITLPEDLLAKYMTKQEIAAFHAGHTGIFSITVYGEKPTTSTENILAEQPATTTITISSKCC